MFYRILSTICAIALLAGSAAAAGKAPEIQIIDGKVSMQADTVPLGRLLRLLDSATGMTSKVPPELSNRNVSVRFTGLPFDAAIHKLFEGQPLDYVLIKGKGVVVTALAQQTASSAVGGGPSPFNESPQFPQAGFVQDPTESPVFNPNPPVQAVQPNVIQSPFGPLPVQQQPPQPVPVPGGAGQVIPNGAVAPFGTLNPFSSNPVNPAPGQPGGNQVAPVSPLFGNTAPVPFQQNAPPK
jgi:hypothetical protein